MSQIQTTLCFTVLISYLVLPLYAFRSDYTFIETTTSFYKYHPEGAKWTDAVSKCESEGGILFYPENLSELTQVVNVLNVKNNVHLWIGISDFHVNGVYQTVDGRPFSQVYNTWMPGEPLSIRPDYRCIVIHSNQNKLYVYGCSNSIHYICKHKFVIEEVVTTATEEVKTIIATAGDKETAALDRLTETLLRQAANQAAVSENQTAVLEHLTDASDKQAAALVRLTETLQGQAANQAAVSENQTAVLEHLKDASDKQTAALVHLTDASDKQIAALERQTDASDKQTAALERLTDAMQEQAANQTAALERLTDAMQEQAANQTAALERLTDAMQEQAANQTAALQKQAEAIRQLARALEKLAVEDDQAQ